MRSRARSCRLTTYARRRATEGAWRRIFSKSSCRTLTAGVLAHEEEDIFTNEDGNSFTNEGENIFVPRARVAAFATSERVRRTGRVSTVARAGPTVGDARGEVGAVHVSGR